MPCPADWKLWKPKLQWRQPCRSCSHRIGFLTDLAQELRLCLSSLERSSDVRLLSCFETSSPLFPLFFPL